MQALARWAVVGDVLNTQKVASRVCQRLRAAGKVRRGFQRNCPRITDGIVANVDVVT